MPDKKWNDHIKLYPTDHVFRVLFLPFIPRWVRPNHLTVLRLILISPVLYYLSVGNYDVGIPLFFFAALTDWFDGSLARNRKQVTEWGIIYDPVVDKLLIGLVLFLIVLDHINFALGVALLAAEAVMIAAGWTRIRKGRIEQANVYGKIKMCTEAAGIMLLLLALYFKMDLFVDLSTGTLALALVFAIISIFSRMI